MDNYQLSRDRAQAYFLNFDQEALIETWHLCHDEKSIYLDFFGRPYRVCRSTGAVVRCWEEQPAQFEEVLSIFDLLCHEGANKHTSGVFAPVNSLKGRPTAIGVETGFYTKTAQRFDRDPEDFRNACLALGGVEGNMADISYRFPVFRELEVILKFYRSDEEFPASVTLLWDENLLQYVFYETVFYMAGFLLGMITKKLSQTG